MAFIPARGGSKRLPNKNILPLAEKPLIAWSINAAIGSKYVDNIFVSTDDQRIAGVSKEHGVDVPELRPKELASDTATTESVLFYTLDKFGKDADIVLILQPTSPLRTSEHIDKALELFIKKNASSVVSVTECEHSPLWANTLPNDGNMNDFIRSEALHRSQDLDVFYRLNGAIYIYDVSKIRDAGELKYTAGTYAYKMDNCYSVDIDTSFDFDIANFLLSKGVMP